MFDNTIKTIKNIKDKRVLVRFDFNVPWQNQKIVDDTRLREALPTLKFLLQKKARIIIVTHLGRPNGKKVASLTLDGVAEALCALIKKPVKKLNNFVGQEVERIVANMRGGEIVMLENIRFSPDEETNSGTLARDLAALADLFIFDGFSVAHRPAASVTGVTKFLPSFVGFSVMREVGYFEKIIKNPKKPLAAIVGGAKMETKIPILRYFSKNANAVLVGGGIFNTMLAARGYGIGASLCDKTVFNVAKKLSRAKNIFLPTDVVVGDDTGKNWRIVTIPAKPTVLCGRKEKILDIGPETIAAYSALILRAKSVVWNGAMGFFEQEPYEQGTQAVALALTQATKKRAFTLAGGGETVEVLNQLKLHKKISFVSTSGGAMLEFLVGKKMPGLKILAGK